MGPVALSVLHDPTQTSLVFSLLRFYRAVCCRALYFQLNALNRLATISLVLRPFTAKPLLRFSYNYTVKSGYEIKLLLKDLSLETDPPIYTLFRRKFFSVDGSASLDFQKCSSQAAIVCCFSFFVVYFSEQNLLTPPGAHYPELSSSILTL